MTEREALDRIYAAVMDNDSGADQLAAVYEVLNDTGRIVP